MHHCQMSKQMIKFKFLKAAFKTPREPIPLPLNFCGRPSPGRSLHLQPWRVRRGPDTLLLAESSLSSPPFATASSFSAGYQLLGHLLFLTLHLASTLKVRMVSCILREALSFSGAGGADVCTASCPLLTYGLTHGRCPAWVCGLYLPPSEKKLETSKMYASPSL